MALIGTITADYDGEISKYYDSQKDVYFILSDYILNKDDWFYYDAVRFDFQEEQMEKKVISSVSGITSYNNQLYIIKDYFNEKVGETYLTEYGEYEILTERTKEYLEQYEKIETVNLSQLPLETSEITNIFEGKISEGNAITCMGNTIDVNCTEASVYYEEGDHNKDLENLISCPNLTYLYLTNNTKTLMDLSALRECKSLKSVWIPDNIDISTLAWLDNVEVLLGNVTDKYVPSLKTMDSLKFVMLDADSKEPDYFRFLSECKTLEVVYLTENVTKEQEQYITNNFPNIQIFPYYYK